ncbi:MAG: hypothetical protein LAT64_00680 [Phycisphaerales bacterium]|nr:hypothetical protein [Planctomycetota bacterium]MCH8507277.1 hypothetical protein [Phycisphaerales bacterium]
MSIARRAIRLILLAALALAIIIISALAANELFAGTTSRQYSFMHRVPYEQDGHGTEYEIGRVHIVHRSRLIRPLDTIRFTVEWEEPTWLVRSGRPVGDPSGTIASMIDDRYPSVPPGIRAEWAASIDGLVQLALRDGPNAALAVPNQERDSTTFPYPIPDSGTPIPEEIFRQGHVVIYPPSLQILGNPIGFLIVWLLAAVILVAVAKRIADATRRRPLAFEARP